jgi:anti-sigma28 factor (negative regulator of flagellin synthesis)
LQLPDVRIELVESVRQAIRDGTYETPEKLEAAVERLLEEEFV